MSYLISRHKGKKMAKEKIHTVFDKYLKSTQN